MTLLSEFIVRTSISSGIVPYPCGGRGDIVCRSGHNTVHHPTGGSCDSSRDSCNTLSRTIRGAGYTILYCSGVGDDNKEDGEKESVSVQQSDKLPVDNGVLPCNGDGNGCHGNHDMSADVKDNGEHYLEHVSTDDVEATVPSCSDDVRSHGAKVGVAGSCDNDDVSPPPNEALVTGQPENIRH